MATPADNAAALPGPRRGGVRRWAGRAVVVLLVSVVLTSAVGWVRGGTREDSLVCRHQRRHGDGAATFYTVALTSSDGRLLLLVVSDRVARADEAALSLAATIPTVQFISLDIPFFSRSLAVSQPGRVIAVPGVEVRTASTSLPGLSLIRQFHLGLSWWVPMALAVIPLAGRVLLLRRARRRRRPGLCRECGYDLRASPGQCPECGTPAAVATPRRPPLAAP